MKLTQIPEGGDFSKRATSPSRCGTPGSSVPWRGALAPHCPLSAPCAARSVPPALPARCLRCAPRTARSVPPSLPTLCPPLCTACTARSVPPALCPPHCAPRAARSVPGAVPAGAHPPPVPAPLHGRALRAAPCRAVLRGGGGRARGAAVSAGRGCPGLGSSAAGPGRAGRRHLRQLRPPLWPGTARGRGAAAPVGGRENAAFLPRALRSRERRSGVRQLLHSRRFIPGTPRVGGLYFPLH